MNSSSKQQPRETPVQVPVNSVVLDGRLHIPDSAVGVVLFAHGSGSSRHSPRNRYVAETFHGLGLGTLLIDLLTKEEDAIDSRTRELRFNVPLWRDRLIGVIDWLSNNPATRELKIGCFGASTGAAGVLMAAAERPEQVHAVVSRGGRPDLAESVLHRVQAPTLLLVGENDPIVLDLNQQAIALLTCEKQLQIIPNATHLFEEPGALADVARLSGLWFQYRFRASDDLESPPNPTNHTPAESHPEAR